ncbi:MAG: cation diffusion facilitator family transporter [Actinomycetota bacterium]|nr:cation diffusion facilitator family transporter [Actinomycetota bacterium]
MIKISRTEKAEVISVATSVFMAGGMIAVAVTTGSIAILAEGIDTVVDIVASLAVLAGLRLSRLHTRNFPTGLYKLENLISTGIGILILVCSYELAAESIRGIVRGGDKVEQPLLVMGTMAVVLAITAAIAWYKGKVGREEHSPSLSADAHHAWTDAVACLAIVVGVGLEMLGIPDMDSVAALVVVAFLIKTGIGVTLESLKVLLDASIEKDVLDGVRRLAEEDPRVRDVIDVTGRNSGGYRFLSLTLVPASYDLREAESTAGELGDKIRHEVENVDQVGVEFTQEERTRVLGAVPLQEDGDTVASCFEDAPPGSLHRDGGARVEGGIPPEGGQSRAEGAPRTRGTPGGLRGQEGRGRAAQPGRTARQGRLLCPGLEPGGGALPPGGRLGG